MTVRSDSLSKRIQNVITRHWQLMTGHTSKNHALKVHNHDDDNNSCITLKDDKKYTGKKVHTWDYWVHVGPLPEKLRVHSRIFTGVTRCTPSETFGSHIIWRYINDIWSQIRQKSKSVVNVTILCRHTILKKRKAFNRNESHYWAHILSIIHGLFCRLLAIFWQMGVKVLRKRT